MLSWPRRPVESTPASAFAPPHCPWSECPTHTPSESHPFRFHRFGSYRRRCDGRTVPRFRCLICRRTLSLQTFAFSYYLKRPDLSVGVAAGLVAGSAHRQIARSLRCAAGTVTRRSVRLGRHAILLLARCLAALGVLQEPVGYDDFESFLCSQDLPFGMGTAVGRLSGFFYGLEQAPHRRGGRLTPRQKARQRRRPSPPRKAYFNAATRTLDVLLRLVGDGDRLTFITDAHPAYASAVGKHPQRERIEHRAYPNPKNRRKDERRSKEAVERDRELHEVDVLHRLMRHSEAHHRRETIAFARRSENEVGRVVLFGAWRNLVKPRWENRPREGTPAMAVGLAKERWSWGRVLAKRVFKTKVELPEGWVPIYDRTLGWPDPKRMRPLVLLNAE